MRQYLHLHREALKLRPAPNPDHARSLHQLAIVLKKRFRHHGHERGKFCAEKAVSQISQYLSSPSLWRTCRKPIFMSAGRPVFTHAKWHAKRAWRNNLYRHMLQMKYYSYTNRDRAASEAIDKQEAGIIIYQQSQVETRRD
jgi:hypothetical protein